ncbi:SAM-dependent methyltransferase [Candidatus Woesearchaeota archaeon CG10_big_fil_rev_8_21_14_0_10_37_12]|nr:MAG: SAM-dependent methyltransferase [Candidatus Woesearchaeota archaeon CG10_big_fil_rev_8_21_14_0_10_37_12]
MSQDKKELYEQRYDELFSFGKNWQKFIKKLDKKSVDEAKKSLHDFLGMSIDDKSFLDIGCGSGLFSLAAGLLDAKVTSVDIDRHSVACAEALKKKYKLKNWKVKIGSALNKEFLDSLGKFDIVYSWGVLHHTGNMWVAIENAASLIRENGLFYIAIYNKNTKYKLEGTSKLWQKIKRMYSHSSRPVRLILYMLYIAYLLVGITAKGFNPVKYIRNYKSNRGMNFFTDVEDWLGGYPYEYASVNEIVNFVGKLGFRKIKIKEVRSLGCNEFLFEKK